MSRISPYNVTQEQYDEAVREHGSGFNAADALGIPISTFYRWKTTGVPKSVRKKPQETVTDNISEEAEPQSTTTNRVSSATGGFSLAGKNLLAVKPHNVWKSRFYALRKGMGYPLDVLEKEWGVSAHTIKEKARRQYNALRYVESSERVGDYIECIVHPDTPKGK